MMPGKTYSIMRVDCMDRHLTNLRLVMTSQIYFALVCIGLFRAQISGCLCTGAGSGSDLGANDTTCIYHLRGTRHATYPRPHCKTLQSRAVEAVVGKNQVDINEEAKAEASGQIQVDTTDRARSC